jgi:hypothetical protein
MLPATPVSTLLFGAIMGCIRSASLQPTRPARETVSTKIAVVGGGLLKAGE